MADHRIRDVFVLTLPATLALLSFLPVIAAEPAPEQGRLMHPGVDGVGYPRVWSKVAPLYPQEAYARVTDATVVAAVMVLSDGSVGELAIVYTDVPNEGFEQSVLKAVSQWQFRPARKGRTPVDSYTFVKLVFRWPDHDLLTARSLWTEVHSKDGVRNLIMTRTAKATMSKVQAKRPVSAWKQYRNRSDKGGVIDKSGLHSRNAARD